MDQKFVILLVLLSAAASAKDVVEEVEHGEDVVLHCKAADVSIGAVEWTRSDLESEEYVFFYRDGKEDPTHQHPSFRGRVELVDTKLKNGNVSVKLKNVKTNDAGTYQCRVPAGSRHRKRAIKGPPISSIRLEVIGPEKRNLPGLYAGLAGFVLVCLTVVGLFVGLKYKKQTEKKPEPADDEGTKDQLV